MVFIINIGCREMRVITTTETAIDIMNAYAVAYGPKDIGIRGTDISGEMAIDVRDWSQSNEWAIFLCENADNLDIECPF